MPQYGMIVYSPAPADPMQLSEDHLVALADYPKQAVALKGKVLGGAATSPSSAGSRSVRVQHL